MTISATVIRGHRVASGLNENPRFPGGTLKMQLPHFRDRGLDLSDYFLSTLNLSIAPVDFKIVAPRITFHDVNWHPEDPPEDFSFLDCRVRRDAQSPWFDGLIYYPHPKTKPAHLQPAGMLEIIAKEKIPGIDYGDRVEIQTDPRQIEILPAAESGE